MYDIKNNEDDINYNKITETFKYELNDSFNYDPSVKYIISDDEIKDLLSKLMIII